MKSNLKTFVVVGMLAVVGGVLGACSSGIEAQAPAAAAAPAGAELEIRTFTFQPKTLQVPVGTTVTWTNADNIEHSVTEGTSPEAVADGFDSGFFTQGAAFAFTFSEPGEYEYFCRRHPSMQGVVEVTPAP